jgi:hypothetical protein
MKLLRTSKMSSESWILAFAGLFCIAQDILDQCRPPHVLHVDLLSQKLSLRASTPPMLVFSMWLQLPLACLDYYIQTSQYTNYGHVTNIQSGLRKWKNYTVLMNFADKLWFRKLTWSEVDGESIHCNYSSGTRWVWGNTSPYSASPLPYLVPVC